MFSDGAQSFNRSCRGSSRLSLRRDSYRYHVGGTEDMQARRRQKFLRRCKQSHKKQHTNSSNNSKNKNRFSSQGVTSRNNHVVSEFCHRVRSCSASANIVNLHVLNSLHTLVVSNFLSEQTACLLVQYGAIHKFLHFLGSPNDPVSARKVAEILVKLAGCNESTLSYLFEIGTVNSVKACLEWCREDESLFCLCLELISKFCACRGLGQILIKNGVIEFVTAICANTKIISLLAAAVDALRAFVDVAQHSQWNKLAPVASFVPRVLHTCRILKAQAVAAEEEASDAQEERKHQFGAFAMDLDAHVQDSKQDEKQVQQKQRQQMCFDDTPRKLAQIEQKTMWLLCEVMESQRSQESQRALLLNYFVDIRMPMESDDTDDTDDTDGMNGQTSQPQQQQKQQKQRQSQTMMNYLHCILSEELQKMQVQEQWEVERCTPILALWCTLAEQPCEGFGSVVLVPDSYALIKCFLLNCSRMRAELLRMICNIASAGGVGSEPFVRWDAELLEQIWNWLKMGNERDARCNIEQREICMECYHLLTTYIKFIASNVAEFLMSSRMLQLIQKCLESKRNFDVWWAITAILAGLERIEAKEKSEMCRSEKRELKKVLNEMQMIGIVEKVNGISALIAENSFGDSVVNALDELLERFFEDLAVSDDLVVA